MLCNDETLKENDDEDEEVDDLYPKYFSMQGRKRETAYVKPRGFSFDDLAATPDSDLKSASEKIM